MDEIFYWDGRSAIPQDVVDVIVNDGVTTIPDFAFSCRSFLRSIVLPSTLTTIGSCAFADCDALKKIIIPEAVSYIGDKAFSLCKNLISIQVESGNSKYIAINGALYEKYTRQDSQQCVKLLQYAVGRTDTEIQLNSPDLAFELTEICNCAFQDCVNITSVVFGEDIETVGNNAFSNCANLHIVSLDTSLQSVGNYAFFGCISLNAITIPSNVKSIGTWAFGYDSAVAKHPQFSIKGYIGTEAESYAQQNDFIFNGVTDVVPVTGIERNPVDVAAYSVAVGKTRELGITVLPEGASDTSIIWKSADPSIATAGQGSVTGHKVGTTTVTATTFNGHYSVSWRISVIIPISSITLDSSTLSTIAGKLGRVTALIEPQDTTRRAITWKSSDTTVVEILSTVNPADDSPNASCTFIPKKPGAVTLTASSDADDVSGTCEITITSSGSSDPQILIRSGTESTEVNPRHFLEIFLKNNPGIVGLNLDLKFDTRKIQLSANSPAFPNPVNYQIQGANVLGTSYHSNNYSGSTYHLCWANDTATENIEYSGKIVTVYFNLRSGASGEIPITVYYDQELLDIYDVELSPVDFAIANSTIKVTGINYGDVNSDNTVNDADVTKLTKYLAHWYNTDMTPTQLQAADLTNDGKVTHRDQAILARYVDSSKDHTATVKQKVRAGDTYELPDNIVDTNPVTSITIVKNNTTVTLVLNTDYIVEGTTITFKSSTNITDTATEATITYKYKSEWSGTIYDTIPFNS